MKKVLLINEGGLGNLGDEAIRRTLEKLLRDANCDVDWVGFSGREEPKRAAVVQARPISTSLWKNLVRKILPVELRWILRTWRTFLRYVRASRYDLVLIGGGQAIQSNGSFGLAMFIWVYLFKKLHKKKVILIGVGAAERYTPLDRHLYRKSLKLVDDIYVRDRDSLSVLKNAFGISSKLIPDVAFYISEIYKYTPRKERRALFCPVSYEFYKRKRTSPDAGRDEDSYFRYWEDQILKHFDDNYQVKLFCTSKNSDLSAVERIRQRLRGKHAIDVEVLDIRTLEEVTREIAKSEVVVSARMHALIIGYAYGCKVIPYRTSVKVKTFEKEYVDSSICLDEVQRRIVSTIKDVVLSP
jgi:polysaccharide pyruvyl transferase WcaK-like protein